mmetsp:Transcript_126166/g.353289  ORF Transcript_126166/g.353289 Transcript_126166/m.353289 type:complete len:371 (+) Transcript_126166:669-1781(+)
MRQRVAPRGVHAACREGVEELPRGAVPDGVGLDAEAGGLGEADGPAHLRRLDLQDAPVRACWVVAVRLLHCRRGGAQGAIRPELDAVDGEAVTCEGLHNDVLLVELLPVHSQEDADGEPALGRVELRVAVPRRSEAPEEDAIVGEDRGAAMAQEDLHAARQQGPPRLDAPGRLQGAQAVVHCALSEQARGLSALIRLHLAAGHLASLHVAHLQGRRVHATEMPATPEEHHRHGHDVQIGLRGKTAQHLLVPLDALDHLDPRVLLIVRLQPGLHLCDRPGALENERLLQLPHVEGVAMRVEHPWQDHPSTQVLLDAPPANIFHITGRRSVTQTLDAPALHNHPVIRRKLRHLRPRARHARNDAAIVQQGSA